MTICPELRDLRWQTPLFAYDSATWAELSEEGSTLARICYAFSGNCTLLGAPLEICPWGSPCGWAIRAAKRWCTSGIATHLFFLQPSAVDSRERSQENKRHRASICAKYNLYQVSVGITLADASWQTSESIWSIWEGARMRTMWDAKGPMGQCHTAFFFPLTGSTLLLPPFSPRSSIRAEDDRREVSKSKGKGHLLPLQSRIYLPSDYIWSIHSRGTTQVFPPSKCLCILTQQF